MASDTSPCHSWQHGDYWISTNPNLIPRDQLNAAFDSDLVPWATKLDDRSLETLISYSVCFGVYHPAAPGASDKATTLHTRKTENPSTALVGFARLITDRVTFAYLADVYTLPVHQGRGLGTRLVSCVKEYLEATPTMTRLVHFVNDDHKEAFYARMLQTHPIEQEGSGKRVRVAKLKGHKDNCKRTG